MLDNSFESETILTGKSLIDLKNCFATFTINQMRIVRVSGFFEEKDWCKLNHFGYVLKGEMKINLNGNMKSFTKGDRFLLNEGERSKHRLIVVQGEYVELLIFEID